MQIPAAPSRRPGVKGLVSEGGWVLVVAVVSPGGRELTCSPSDQKGEARGLNGGIVSQSLVYVSQVCLLQRLGDDSSIEP